MQEAPSSPEQSVVILAPTGNDAVLAQEVLGRSGIMTEIVSSAAALRSRLEQPAAAAVIAEEALETDSVADLTKTLERQEPWSDLPVLLLTASRIRNAPATKSLASLAVRSNFTLLERPFRIITLVSAVRGALRARERQYQLRELLYQQEASLRLKDEFMSIASHELRTPITALKLQVALRQRQAQRNPERAEGGATKLIAMIDQQIDRMARLIDEMLDIARIQNQKVTLNRSCFNLGDLVAEVYHSLVPAFQLAGCESALRRNSKLTGYWDRDRLEQVIINLFTNAMKYGAEKPVFVEVSDRAGKAVLTVRDSGEGIAPADQQRIFQRFERVVSEGSVGGLGVGLYIAKEIVALHGGEIYVDSHVGGGSTFVVELPVEGENAPKQ